MLKIKHVLLGCVILVCSGCADAFIDTWSSTFGRSYRAERNAGRVDPVRKGEFRFIDGSVITCTCTDGEFREKWHRLVADDRLPAMTSKEWGID